MSDHGLGAAAVTRRLRTVASSMLLAIMLLVSTGPDRPLALADLLARIAAIRAIGAEPLVILSYLPAWLGQPIAFGRDPTRVRPADLDAWQRVVHDVVLVLATAPAPALRFEAWNEPDIPLFWQDTPTAWVDTVERSGRAIADVERETGLDLAFGGPADVRRGHLPGRPALRSPTVGRLARPNVGVPTLPPASKMPQATDEQRPRRTAKNASCGGASGDD